MGILELVMQMRNQGNTDSQIINYLRQQRVSPKEIYEALSQSQIKEEIKPKINDQYGGPPSVSEMPKQITPDSQMKPSMMYREEKEEEPVQEEADYQETPSEEIRESMQMQVIPSSYQPYSEPVNNNARPPAPIPQPNDYYPQNYPQNQEAYAAYPQQYPGYLDYQQYPEYSPGGGDIETISEIAEQIAEEKIGKVKKEIENFKRFREEIAIDVEKMNERLLRIENTLNNFQASILGRVGEYGRSIQELSKEMQTTQNSFSKILDPLTDNIRKLEKINQEKDIKRPKPQVKAQEQSAIEQKPQIISESIKE